MALVLADRVKETTTTTGTGTITLAGASTGFQSFAVIGNANTTYYTIVDSAAGAWEVGIGTYTLSGTTLSRDTVLSNSLGTTAKINFAAGTKDVFVTYPAGESVYYQDTGGVVITESGTAAALRVTNTGTGNSLVIEDAANPDASPFVVNASGNVGIGTSSPDAQLTVNTIASFGAGAVGTPSIAAKGDLNTGLWFPAADTIAVSTGGTEQARITSAGLFQFNSGYGSVATGYGCRAWVNLNGTGTPAIRASGNVSSITDNGTGAFTVNFTTAMPDANYAIVCTTGNTDGAAEEFVAFVPSALVATSSVKVRTSTGSGVAADLLYNSCAVFR